MQIGLAGWGDHDAIYAAGTKSSDKLKSYADHFSIVELDSSFYAIPSVERMQSWIGQTPSHFSFIVKAYQGMTGHSRGKIPFADSRTMFNVFRESVETLQQAGKLKAALFQYPPWFDCSRKHVDVLRRTRTWMEGIPVALEFRHQSWFRADMHDKTLAFMEQEGWIHSICDEPQAGEGSVPMILHPTEPSLTMIRMHGRNVSGWNASGQPNWREVRYLYDYNEAELEQWSGYLRALTQQTAEVCMIFNNNSGGHAAGNAKQLMSMLGQPVTPMPMQQMTIFDE
ncbi:DUF72 domain-containing protein [Paenibacillus sp. 481]|nr:DUF72 domain-containing protein [Paenibacillus sp. 481]